MSWSTLSTQAKFAGVLAILGFFVTLQSLSTTSRNGVIQTCSFFDIGAVLLGAGAVLFGVIGLAGGNDQSEGRGASLAICGIGVAVGVYHVLRGVGVVGGPC